jgi:methylenetetrahydrofolate--tRNA-(uracil-5-)-methyltransferase
MTKTSSFAPIHVIGGGLAGSEAAWQIAESGVPVILHEMRGVRGTDAHKTDGLAELVCSNSFRSDDATSNAVGVLHAEMRLAGSLIMRSADANQVPAGGALAVDRDGFSIAVTAALESHPLITITREEVTGLPPEEWDQAIIATGPLTAPSLAAAIQQRTGADSLAFFDAIAPIVHTASIDMDICWFQSRYDKVGPGGTGKDYINCPMDEAQYNAFVDALIAGDTTGFKEWEGTPYFDGCLPIESDGRTRPRDAAPRPDEADGLTNAHNPTVKAYAVVQLRQDNALGTLYNMVGFQTKLKYGAQAEIFRLIPGLENAEFARLGGLHRNTYINSPTLLDRSLTLKGRPGLRFRRPDHRLRRVCGKRQHRPARRPFRRRRAPWRNTVAAAGNHGVRRPARPYHRRPSRLRRRARQTLLPADERQFRPVPAAGTGCRDEAGRLEAFSRQGQGDRQETGNRCPGAGRLRAVA